MNTVPFTATVAPAFAGLGDTVSVMVARAGLIVSVVGADVLPVRGLPGAGLYVDVTVYVPGAPGAGKTSVKVELFTGKVYCVGAPMAPPTCTPIYCCQTHAPIAQGRLG